MRIPIGETELGFWEQNSKTEDSYFTPANSSYAQFGWAIWGKRCGTYAEFKKAFPYNTDVALRRSKTITKYNKAYNKQFL